MSTDSTLPKGIPLFEAPVPKFEQDRAPEDILAVLRETPFFSSLDPVELDAVAKCVVRKGCSAGETVLRQGHAGDCFYIVRTGRVRVEKEMDGKKVRLAEIGPGGAFGEMSLIDDVPVSATVTAAEPSQLLGIGRLDLNVLLNWNPVLAAKMWRAFTKMLSERVREMNEQAVTRS